jgi:hypothetical protein
MRTYFPLFWSWHIFNQSASSGLPTTTSCEVVLMAQLFAELFEDLSDAFISKDDDTTVRQPAT